MSIAVAGPGPGARRRAVCTDRPTSGTDGSGVVARVRDDGRGLDPAVHGAVALQSMRARAAATGGRLGSRRAPGGRGTEVRLAIPVAEKSAEMLR